MAGPEMAAKLAGVTHRQFVAPPLYLQGPGVLGELAALAARLGVAPVAVTDAGVEQMLAADLGAALPGVPRLMLEGEITPAALARLAAVAAARPCDVVLGIGGGKAIDAGKSVARATGARYVSVPTIASNDAPTSGAIALYDDADHRLRIESLGRSPDAVVVDTRLIARAPARFLRCGIGDALAKAGEAEGCAAAADGLTLHGARPALAGLALARCALATLRRHAAQALAVAGSGTPDAAFEATIEAVILMSGLGFENGGLGLAHAMTRGLIAAPRTRYHAHGEHVAYGMLVQLALDAGDDALRGECAFVSGLGLPTRLAWFAPGAALPDEIAFLAEMATTADQHCRNWREPLDAARIATAIARLEGLE